MADFATAGGSHWTGFANGVGGEVVVMEVQLLGVGMEVIHLLRITGGSQGCGGQHLR